MKFVCDRCLTKYSIADDKVRGRILKIRCKSCSNIITVKESAPLPISVADGESERTVITSGPRPPSRPAQAQAPAAKRPRPKTESGRHTRPPTPAPAGDEIQWFLALEGVQKGPFARKVLIDRLAALPKHFDVHVWNDTLDRWRPPAEVPVIARELQARQRPAPPPPPPAPPPRLHPVPPPPSHAAHAASHVAHPAAGRGHSAPHPLPAMSAGPLGLGAAAAAAPAIPVDSAGLFDTPAPMRELVQAHKAQNGIEGHASSPAIAGAPSALSSNGESDAIQALNLGGSWQQPGAPSSATTGGFSSAAVVVAAGVRQRQRNLKLASGFIAVVGICLALFFIAFKKPPGPAVAANPPVAARVEPPPVLKAPEAPKETRPATDPVDPESVGNGASGKLETVARVSSGKKATRPAPVRNPFHSGGTSATSPSGFTPEQRAEANRYGDTSGRAIQLRNPTATIAKVTPAQNDITRVVNNNKGGIKVCYQRALLRDNSLTHGKIDVRVSIGVSGRVKNVGIDGPASFRTLDPCIKDVLSRWVFPASSEEYGTEFSYLFSGNE